MLRCLVQTLQLPGGLETHLIVAAQLDPARAVRANLKNRLPCVTDNVEP